MRFALCKALLPTRLRSSTRLHDPQGSTRLHGPRGSTVHEAPLYTRLSKAPLSTWLQSLQDLVLYETPLSTKRGSTRPLLQGAYSKVRSVWGPLLQSAYAELLTPRSGSCGGLYSKVSTPMCLHQGAYSKGPTPTPRLLTPSYLL